MDSENYKQRRMKSKLNKNLPRGIYQDGFSFHHPELGLVNSWEKMWYEGMPETTSANFQARRRFNSWWRKREGFIEKLSEEPMGSRLLFADQLGEALSEEQLRDFIHRLEDVLEQKAQN